MPYDFSVLRELRKKRSLTISDFSALCNVSYVALSKLERNQGNPELHTLDRISRAIGMPTHTFLALAEQHGPSRTKEKTSKTLGKADCRHVNLDGVKICCIRAPRGAKGDTSELHGDDHERCFVLEGKLKITVADDSYTLSAGDALGWDGLLDHHFEVLEPTTFITVLSTKGI